MDVEMVTERQRQLKEIDQELTQLKALLEDGLLYAPPSVLYHEPSEIPGFVEQLEQQRTFVPRLKEYLKKAFAKRYIAETERRRQFIKDYNIWQQKLRPIEANDPPISKPSKPSDAVPIGNATSNRGSRRAVASDAVRSEEELNRVLLSLLEQERDNPATRWMATLAVTPSMHEADPKHIFNDIYKDQNGLLPQGCYEKPTFELNKIPMAQSVVHSNGQIVWTDAEQKAFVDKFLAYPKNFRKIASFLPHKKTADCVAFYYRNKKRLRLKQLRKMAANEANFGKARAVPIKRLGGPGRPPKVRKPGRPPKNRDLQSTTSQEDDDDEDEEGEDELEHDHEGEEGEIKDEHEHEHEEESKIGELELSSTAQSLLSLTTFVASVSSIQSDENLSALTKQADQ